MSNDKKTGFCQAHLDVAAFRAAVERTAHDFDFRPLLVEKDYFCSLLLQAISFPEASWIFKGGTCLSKIYTDFYRLSEDLDFCIPIQGIASRPEKRRLIDPAKRIVDTLPDKIAGVRRYAGESPQRSVAHSARVLLVLCIARLPCRIFFFRPTESILQIRHKGTGGDQRKRRSDTLVLLFWLGQKTHLG